MTSIKVTFDFEKIKRKLILNDNEIKELGDKILIVLADRLVELIKEKSPKKTGKYAEGWKREDPQDGTIAVTNPDGLKYNMFEFTGRRPTKIEAEKGKVLHFQINGEDIFVTFVNHPGFSVQPHARPALEDLGREVRKLVLDTVKKEHRVFK